MQKQIEFIREKVIMANNPECKTLEEALEEEVNSAQCQFILTDNDNCVVNSDYIGKYYHHNNNYKILGLPLTLERLFASIARISSKIEEVKVALSPRLRALCITYGCHSFIWQTNKTLENQSNETIQRIAEILGYNKIINNSN